MLLQTNGDTNLQAQQVVVMLPAAQIKAREINDALPMPVIFKTEHKKYFATDRKLFSGARQ